MKSRTPRAPRITVRPQQVTADVELLAVGGQLYAVERRTTRRGLLRVKINAIGGLPA